MLLLVKCYDNKMFKSLVDPTNIPFVGNGGGEPATKKEYRQDTVVLGKNARHSFGRAQDRIPLPTREAGHRINRNAKRRIGNDTRTQARERPVTRGPVFFGMDSIRARKRTRRLDPKLLRRENEKETRF